MQESRKTGSLLLVLFSFSLLQMGAFLSLAFAGGPVAVAPGGRPVRWSPARIGFVIDNGPLGSTSRDAAATQVRAAFQAWEDVETSSITFEDRGFLPVDVNLNNYDQYLEVKRPEGNVIVFDSDGSITDDFFGEESDDVLGFATAVRAGSTSDRFDFGFAVLNGRNSTSANFRSVLIHELGHMIGLDHTQAGHAQALNGRADDNGNVPIMYPFSISFAAQQPRPDDRAWLSWLYPAPGFEAATGTISGQILHPRGDPLPGANVVAVRLTSAGTEDPREFVSVVSDFLVKQDGSFEIPGLTPGEYVVFIEPLFSEFTGGSGVGPFDFRFENFFKDYFNAESESDRDDPAEKIVLNVGAGQTIEGINLIANEIFNRLDLLTDDGEMLFRFPEGFTFPFFGKTYTEVYVNSDGNLTFERGDGVPGMPRDPARFLSGPPRIAPLFTDLDPSVSGEVTTVSAPGEFTVIWDGVPEFSDSGSASPNRFSVTLFSTGNIRFKYEATSVTPDPDDRFEGGLQVIVGITPGGGADAGTADLSSLGSSVPLDDQPIYQVFSGTSFDLGGRQINFVTNGALQSQLLFPFYAGDAAFFSGYAFTNLASQDALLEIQAHGPDGALLSFLDNPHAETVASNTQTARLGSEFFNIPAATPQSGWVRVLTNTPGLASFFQYGNGMNGPISMLDGSVAVTEQSKILYFTRIYDGEAVFPTFAGAQDAVTRISLVNPNDSSVTVRFTFFDPTGFPIGPGSERQLPPNGFILERVSSLIGVPGQYDDGYLKAEVIQGEGAIGFELIELEDSLMGLNASYGNPGDVAFSAQLAGGSDTGIPVFTNLKLVNTSDSPRILTITAFGADGNLLSPPLQNVALMPNQTFQFDAGEAFAGSPIAGFVGSLLVEADGPGVIGDVVFGDPETARYAAALPLQTALFTEAVFSQVANGQLTPDPSMDCFTGIAFFNPNDVQAQVSLRVFNHRGQQIGSTRTLTLGPRNRLADLVENLVAGTSDLIQGFISLESTQPLVAQQLFGNGTLSFLSAVPPQIVR